VGVVEEVVDEEEEEVVVVGRGVEVFQTESLRPEPQY
jgi:hypothetical protein